MPDISVRRVDKHILLCLIFFSIGYVNELFGQKAQHNKEAVRLNDQALMMLEKYFQSSDSLKKAISILDKAISIDPTYSSLYFNKESALCLLNLYQQAINTLNDLLLIHPHNGSAILTTGMILEKLGRYTEAQKKYQSALKLYQGAIMEYPDSILLATSYIPVVFLANGKEEAVKEYNKIKTRFRTSNSALDTYEEMLNMSREELIDGSCGKKMR